MTRLKSLLLFTICLNGALGFLPTRLNFADPDLSTIFCESSSGKTVDLKAITREGIRREIRDFFNEEPPSGSTDFFVPEDASLSEMFHMYYGNNTSATRFFKAVNTIAWSNADVDSMESTKYDTRYHFDGEQLTEGQALLTNRHNMIVSSLISNQSYDFARQQIGYSLHAIQDFYSHTNWFEIGNDEIIEFLGIPGYTLPNVATPTDVVCSECPSDQGSCIGNVATIDKLTSGYYEYDVSAASPFIKEKPLGTGKCSFGGSLDDSRSINPIGGINKATTSACFSPHFYYHTNAVELAEEATQNYLSIIRDAVGNEKFRFLFDLYEGSALVIVIDTTGSMGGEILAVQQEVSLIVQTAPAELYILVPYGDPYYGPVLKTTDSQVFLDAVNNLGPFGGGDQPEMVWSALQLAIVNTPDYSNLYLFTDAGGKDYQLMNGDFAMAQEKNIICTTIFGDVNDQLDGPPATDDSDFINLATVTGGEFVLIDDFSVDNVVSIIDNGIESNGVSLAVRRDMTGDIGFDALVDNTISYLEITIYGDVDVATITDPDGTMVDLMDFDALNASSSITIIAYAPKLIDVAFNDPIVGIWDVQISGDGNFSATADGASTLGYMIEFTELDTRPPRPNYKLIRGQPIIGNVYYVETTLVGWIESRVTSVATMDFLDKRGNILSQVSNTEPVDDEFYIQSNPLPDQNFYVAVNGFLASGEPFIRLYETLITPSLVIVDIDLSRSVLSAPPDTTVEAYYDVFNYGENATYNYYASDDQNFVVDFQPNSSFIEAGGSSVIIVTLTVPAEAIPWTESTIVVTASDSENDQVVNSEISYFMVVPEDRDNTAPTCIRNNEPDCTGFTSATNCGDGSWIVSATLLDTESGLSTIYTQPSNNDTYLNTTNFVSGTTSNVNVELTASCCVTQLRIIGVDEQGNIGICDYEMAPLDGVLTFEAIDEGTTWVYLRWTVDAVRPDLFKYSLLTDFGFNNDIACFDTVCYYNVTNLQPCSNHHFELTPYFDPNNDFNLVAGNTAVTEDATLDKVPDPPINGMISNTNDSSVVLVSWDPPSDDRCIIEYTVCYVLAGSKNVSQTTLCITSIDNSASITGLEPCSLYGVNITSVTTTGLRSDPAEVDASSGDAYPGPPTNLKLDAITVSSATISWDAPDINPQCVENYEITWYPVGSNGTQPLMLQSTIVLAESGEFSATVSPLTSCENYTFVVYAVSPGGLDGPDAITYGETNETTPSDPSNLVLQATGTTSINASWNAGAGICVEYYDLCLNDPVAETENCTDVYSTNHELEGLRSCTMYTINVAAKTPSGFESARIFSAEATDDDVPGPPTKLNVTTVTPHTVTIEFDPPTVNPQCVDEYDIEYIDLDANNLPKLPSHEVSLHLRSGKASNTNTLTGLTACTDLQIMVRAVSPQGFESPFTNVTTETTEEVPSSPSNLQQRSATTTTIGLRWFAPSNNPRCAEMYKIIWVAGGTGASGSDLSPVVAKTQYEFEYTIEGLVSCTTYNIGVSGITALSQQGLSSTTTASTSC